MSENQLFPDDPRLTAFALGELDPTEQAAVERLLADSPAAQAAVDEIRGVATLLTNELRQEPAPELTDAQRSTILAGHVVTPVPRRVKTAGTPRPRVMWFASLATIASLFIITALLLPTGDRNRGRHGELSSDLAAADIKGINAVPTELLDELKRHEQWNDEERQIATDKLRSAVRNSEFRAERLAATDPETALSVIDVTQGIVDLSNVDPAVTSQLRKSLARSRDYINYRKNSPTGEMASRKKELEETIKREERRGLRIEQDFADKVERYNDLLKQKRFDEAIVAGKEARLAQPENPVGELMVLKARFAKQEDLNRGLRDQRPDLFTSQLNDLSEENGERSALVADGSARFAGGRQSGKNMQPTSRRYNAGQGEKQNTNGHLTGIGNDVAQPVASPADRKVTDLKLTGGSRAANRPMARAPESPRADFSRIESEKDKIPVAELGVTTTPASGSGKQPATDPKVKKYSGTWTPPLVTANTDSSPRGMGGPGNGGGGGGFSRGGGRPDPALGTDKYSDDFSYDLARKGAASEWEAKRLADRESRGDRDDRQKDGNGNEFVEGYIRESLTLSTDHFQRKENLARQSTELFLGTEAYDPIVENPFLSSYENPLSTFGVDVDTASYANMRRFLTQQQLPPPNAVRIEELVNYFSYDYPQPAGEQPFSVNVEAGRCPWSPGNGLVRIGLKGKEIDASQRPSSNLVFLVDVSGSMQAENKLPLVKMGLNLLTQQMTESDRVAIVTYSDTAVQRLESTNGTNKPAILGVIDSLQAGGSTNGAGGIQLAYRAALDHFVAGGTNRVILCTDGDFNVGVTGDDELVQLIQERARTKVFFSVLGFGMGNLKDGKLEKLADRGNGQYAYIDSQREARKVFVDDLAGTLVTIAKDVKLQVEFNPTQVGAYRLIGYENRVMAAQDFNNDAKDAGDIGAGHTVTALYETLPAGEAPKSLLGDTLRYRAAVVPQEGGLAHELLTVKLRYKLPEADTSTLVEVPVNVPKDVAAAGFGDGGAPPPRTGMSADFNWSASVAAFGMILRNSQFRGQSNFDMVLELAQGAKGEDKTGRRQEFIDLVKSAKALYGGSPAAGVVPFEPAAVPLTREQAEAKATVNGKYKNLLRFFEAPGDSAVYGSFYDYGRWEGTSYLHHNDLPQGYWVYVSPNWYIWGDK